MAKISLLGGVAGVGKTTLFHALMERYGDNGVLYFDPGEIYRRDFYLNKLKTIPEIEDSIADEMISSMSRNFSIISHWHYAVHRPGGYIPQISFERIKKVAESEVIDMALLVLVEAPADIILARRLKDARIKTRPLSLEIINEEIAREREFLEKELTIFTKVLGVDRVQKIVI